MSDTPLSRLADAPVVIMLCANVDEFTRVMLSYGLDPTLEHGVFPAYDLNTAYDLSLTYADAIWCIAPDGNPAQSAIVFLRSIYGEALTIAKALNVQNNEYAINPDVLRRAGA